MKIIDKSLLGEVKNMKDGEFGLFEYVDCGHCFQDKFIAVGGEMFFETESYYFLDDLERAAAIPAQAHSPDRGPVSTLPTGRVGYILPGRC